MPEISGAQCNCLLLKCLKALKENREGGEPVRCMWMMPRAFIPNASWARTDDRRCKPQPPSTSSRPILPGSLAQFYHGDCLDTLLCFIIVLPTRLSILIWCSALHNTRLWSIVNTSLVTLPPLGYLHWLALNCPPGRVRRVVCLVIAREDSARVGLSQQYIPFILPTSPFSSSGFHPRVVFNINLQDKYSYRTIGSSTSLSSTVSSKNHKQTAPPCHHIIEKEASI